ncbi:hypothetical protein IAU60_003698 [Kwoniella sp. DSM 27419]
MTKQERDPLPDPVYRAGDIEADKAFFQHWHNPEAQRYSTDLTDKVGMRESGVGVSKTRLEPGALSSEIHYHLNDSEWIYILSGTATLTLLDASIPLLDPSNRADAIAPTATDAAEERQVHAGDFIGFPAGLDSSRRAHCLRAGPEGVDYLEGGSRLPLDVVNYPR